MIYPSSSPSPPIQFSIAIMFNFELYLKRVYKVSTSNRGADKSASSPQPVQLTPNNEFFAKDCLYRFADGVMDFKRNRLICIREDHTDPSPLGVVNCLVGLSLDGSGSIEILASGNDFYSCPRLSPCGNKLAYITWNHPNMPWDSTELKVMNLKQQEEEGKEESGSSSSSSSSAAAAISSEVVVAGREGVSIMQPLWNPVSGDLYFLSDESNGFFNIHKLEGVGELAIADETWASRVSFDHFISTYFL
jgi:hypothetical protein